MGVIPTKKRVERRTAPSARPGTIHRSGPDYSDADNPALRPRRVAGAKRIRERDLPVFTRTLSAMLSAGLPINDCLRSLREQVGSPGLGKILAHVGTLIQDGNSLSTGFAVFPSVFDPIYTGMLRTGEASGRMAETLESLAEHLEETAELRHRVRSAMMYPIAVAALAGLLISGILMWIVPAFAKIYAEMGRTLPAATRFLIAVSQFVRDRVGLVIVFVVALVAGLRVAGRTPSGRRFLDRIILAVPIVGPLVQKVAITRLSESLSQMLRNGVPILSALRLVGPAIGNSIFEDAVDVATTDITQGEKLSVAMKRNRCFTPMMIEMVLAGERTGQLEAFLTRVADFYRREVSVSVRGLASLIEPLLIVFLGVVVGGMVVCMFIPIFRLHELAQ